jgi:hypothetical protein
LTAAQILVPVKEAPGYFPPTPVAEMPTRAWVDFRFSVDEAGNVRRPQVIGSRSANSAFVNAARSSLVQWKFCPRSEIAAQYPDALVTRFCLVGSCPQLHGAYMARGRKR